jgi:excisionase family DNA binding protein
LQWVRTKYVSEAFNVPMGTLYDWIDAGRLPASKIGKRLYIRVRDIEDLLATHAVKRG